MFKYTGIRVGADPELFIRRKGTTIFFPACGLVGGTKQRPKKIDNRGHAVQEDNVMVEFNIRPAKTRGEFVESNKFVLGYLTAALPEFDLDICASARFDEALLAKAGYQAMVFGCDPDYNAWTWEVNSSPEARTNLRTAGGHIHIGYKNPAINNQVELIRAMDLFLGVPSIILDKDVERRQRYGKAGAFRPKEYGTEFRTVSNFWLKSEELMGWAYDNAVRAVDFLNKGETISKKLGIAIQHCINNNNKEQATGLCKEFALLPR